MTSLFSIIVPVYNDAAQLPRCVNSVLAQRGEWELLLVDDGSTDGSGALCDGFAAACPDTVRVLHQENRGPGAARNAGLAAARGDYVLFADSDDFFEGCALFILAARLRETDRPDMLFYNYRCADAAGRTLYTAVNALPPGAPSVRDEGKRPLLAAGSVWNRAVRRGLFAERGIAFPAGVWYEDFGATAKLGGGAARCAFVPDVLYNYVVRPGSIMQSPRAERKADMLAVFDDVLAWFEQSDLRAAYHAELEYLCAYHILYAASIDILKRAPYHPVLDDLRAYARGHFPDAWQNEYVRGLSLRRRLTLGLLARRHYTFLHAACRAVRGRPASE